jgi:acyltransferase
MDTTKNKQLDFIDFLKGAGIFSIVWGHSMVVKSAYLYSFHLPLFFLISGFLYKKTVFPIFLVNKINRILIPFVFFFLLSWLIFFILILSGYDAGNLAHHVKLLPYVLIGIEKDGGNGPIWYLACLFSLVLMYSLLDNYIKDQYLLNLSILLVLIAGFLCVRWHIHLPYRTEIAFSAILFYHLGYCFKKFEIQEFFRSRKWIKWSVVLLLIILHYFAYTLNIKISGIHNVNMIANITGNIYLFYASAIFAMTYVFLISTEFPKINFINYLGQNSLVILAIHVLILHFIYDPLHLLFNHFPEISGLFSIVVTILCILICLPFIYFSKNYIPKLTGYKSLIVIDRFSV